MKTENIERFLQTAYSDAQLAASLAHAQDGKLEFRSCCCLVGIPTADHALQGFPEDDNTGPGHYLEALGLLYAKEAEIEFRDLGGDGEDRAELRRQRLIPLILAEQERRSTLVFTCQECNEKCSRLYRCDECLREQGECCHDGHIENAHSSDSATAAEQFSGVRL